MEENIRFVSVNADNVEQEGFFCYKSKPGTAGYQNKLAWLKQQFAHGMGMHIVYMGKRSVGYIEYMPGETTWRAVNAEGCMVIHCLWVVGRAKDHGLGSHLLHLCLEDARERGMPGVVMISSTGNWLAKDNLFLKHGFERVDECAPFSLWLYRFEAGPTPSFPTDWEARRAAFGPGVTITYADQCPYMPDAVKHAQDQFAARGLSSRVVKFETAEQARTQSPTPYGVFGIVVDGKLLSYTYLDSRILRRLDEEFLQAN